MPGSRSASESQSCSRLRSRLSARNCCTGCNVPSEHAVDELIALIKEHGMWVEAEMV